MALVAAFFPVAFAAPDFVAAVFAPPDFAAPDFAAPDVLRAGVAADEVADEVAVLREDARAAATVLGAWAPPRAGAPALPEAVTADPVARPGVRALRARIGARNRPVWLSSWAATSSGVPVATTWPPR